MFNNKVVVITGGSSGLGSALAERFIAAGAHVALIARDKTKLAAIKADLTKNLQPQQKLETYSCDVIDFAACEATMQAIADALGRPHILINSAGILKEGYFDEMPMKVFRDTMDINFFGVLHCIRAALPHFDQAGTGRIVNIASMAGRGAAFGYSAYCSSKFALVGLTEVLRSELVPRGIEVQLVCPGEFDTPMVQGLGERTPENLAATHTIPPLSLEQVAEEVFAGIVKRHYLIVPGRIARLADLLNRLLPGAMRSIMDAKLKKVYVGPKRAAKQEDNRV